MAAFTCRIAVILNTVLIQVTAGVTLSTSAEQCVDRKDCSGFDIERSCCGIYEDWARYNCPVHCRFCTPSVTTSRLCVDTIPNCQEYGNDLCTEHKYEHFVETKCAGYCKLCEKPEYYPPCVRHPNITAGTTTLGAPLSVTHRQPTSPQQTPTHAMSQATSPQPLSTHAISQMIMTSPQPTSTHAMSQLTSPQPISTHVMSQQGTSPKPTTKYTTLQQPTSSATPSERLTPSRKPYHTSQYVHSPTSPSSQSTYPRLTSHPTFQQPASDQCSHAGVFYPLGGGWYTEHCLQWCECLDPKTNNIQCGPKKCPPWTEGCRLVFHHGECCPTLICPDREVKPLIG